MDQVLYPMTPVENKLQLQLQLDIFKKGLNCELLKESLLDARETLRKLFTDQPWKLFDSLIFRDEFWLLQRVGRPNILFEASSAVPAMVFLGRTQCGQESQILKLKHCQEYKFRITIRDLKHHGCVCGCMFFLVLPVWMVLILTWMVVAEPTFYSRRCSLGYECCDCTGGACLPYNCARLSVLFLYLSYPFNPLSLSCLPLECIWISQFYDVNSCRKYIVLQSLWSSLDWRTQRSKTALHLHENMKPMKFMIDNILYQISCSEILTYPFEVW